MRLDWKAVLGIAITVILLWLILRGQDLTSVWEAMRSGDMVLLTLSAVVATLGFLVRALRWKVLLTPLEPDTRLGSRFAAVSIGFMGNNLLPARMGEFARAFALSRVEPVSASAAFGTLVVERVLDTVVIFVILVATISAPSFPTEGVLAGSVVGAAVQFVLGVIGLAVVFMVLLVAWPRPVVRVGEAVASRLPGDLSRPIVGALESFLQSLEIIRSPRLLTLAVLWTVAFWLWHSLSFYLGMLAFGIRPEGTFIAALFTEAVVGFAVALPSAPGFLGPFQFAADFALADVYGVESSRSLAFAFGYYFAGWLPITAIGLWYASRLGLSLSDVGRSERVVEAEVGIVEMSDGGAASVPGPDRRPARRSGPNPAGPGSVGIAGAAEDRHTRPSAVEMSAPAKVNLLLKVLGPRGDGFHELETLFQAIALHDSLHVTRGGETGIRLDVDGPDVGTTTENLVWRAADAFMTAAELDDPLEIRLRKRIPAGAGLGGGSSDAAATLRALDRLFGAPLPPSRLRDLALGLGSDVPFFLSKSPTALAWGRGERLRSLGALPVRPIVLVMPPFRIETGEAYRLLADARESGAVWGRAAFTDLAEVDWAFVGSNSTNDFEAVLYERTPELSRIAEALAATGPLVSLLSGSGSALFAVYEEEERAAVAAEHSRRDFPSCEVVLTRTLAAFE